MKGWICGVLGCLLILSGCSFGENLKKEIVPEIEEAEDVARDVPAPARDSVIDFEKSIPSEPELAEPEIAELEGEKYFDSLCGAAVLFVPADCRYLIYNQELAMTRRSPCSTFKIISSLTALENGILEPEYSTRTWSGEVFWNEDWNQDIDFDQAFRASCVWYFRELIDEIGKERMQKELDRLSYGNCDISDWEGRLNTNNNNRALTGFWIESSLLISPKEQAEVMERIFGEDSPYSAKIQEELRQVMKVELEDVQAVSVYGKTGMGKAKGVTVDAWFTGFAEHERGPVYFCVYLGETQGREVSSTMAREIAVRMIGDYYGILKE